MSPGRGTGVDTSAGPPGCARGRRRMLGLAMCGGLGPVLLAGCERRAAPPEPWVAPTVLDPEGRPRPLQPPSGQRALVHLWARWCAPCRRELPALQRLARRLDGRRATMLVLAIDDDPFALREFLRDLGFTWPVWRAPHLPAGLAVPALPMTLVLDAQGRITHRRVGAQAWDMPQPWLPPQALGQA